mmetsp:Transcript_55334/g.177436  ORF Transcript_55334/g.177436 Transcript_55334/m.177436 type:complete len:472 (-) Transcript_55334:37-1452(-)
MVVATGKHLCQDHHLQQGQVLPGALVRGMAAETQEAARLLRCPAVGVEVVPHAVALAREEHGDGPAGRHGAVRPQRQRALRLRAAEHVQGREDPHGLPHKLQRLAPLAFDAALCGPRSPSSLCSDPRSPLWMPPEVDDEVRNGERRCHDASNKHRHQAVDHLLLRQAPGPVRGARGRELRQHVPLGVLRLRLLQQPAEDLRQGAARIHRAAEGENRQVHRNEAQQAVHKGRGQGLHPVEERLVVREATQDGAGRVLVGEPVDQLLHRGLAAGARRLLGARVEQAPRPGLHLLSHQEHLPWRQRLHHLGLDEAVPGTLRQPPRAQQQHAVLAHELRHVRRKHRHQLADLLGLGDVLLVRVPVHEDDMLPEEVDRHHLPVLLKQAPAPGSEPLPQEGYVAQHRQAQGSLPGEALGPVVDELAVLAVPVVGGDADGERAEAPSPTKAVRATIEPRPDHAALDHRVQTPSVTAVR